MAGTRTPRRIEPRPRAWFPEEDGLAQRPPQRRFFVLFTLYWLPVLGYATAVLVVGSQSNLQPPMRFENADKLCHVLEYAGLGFLLARALRASMRVRLPLSAALLAIGLGGAVGVADELHQLWVPGRDSSVFDWFADMSGLVLAQLAFLLTRRD